MEFKTFTALAAMILIVMKLRLICESEMGELKK